VESRMAYIQGIDNNLGDDIRKAMLDAIQNGQTLAQLGDAIRTVFQGRIDYHSRMISRTETMQAYAAASLSAYAKAGITQVRMYDGDNDDSANCSSVNGMIVSIDEAIQLMAAEHPQGTRGVSPIVDLHLASMQENLLAPGIKLVA